MPEISIITPVFNSEKTLERCIRSVLAQNYTDYELILIDDGSTDCSGSLGDSFAAMDSRISIWHTDNHGVSSARNTGITKALGRYLFFLDSDDALEPDALSVYSAAAENGTNDVVIGRLSVIAHGVETREIGIERDLIAGSEIWELICQDTAPFGYAGGKMIRTELIKENGIRFNTKMRSQEDLDFFLSAYPLCQRFRLIPYAGYCYYYMESTRNPPISDLISNQMKALRGASQRTTVSVQACQAVIRRIQGQVYTSLYHAAGTDQYSQIVQQLTSIDGLISLLSKASSKGEAGLVAGWFAKGKHKRIRNYFAVRNTIRDAARKLHR